MMNKGECRVSELTTEYNKNSKRRLSDFTIRKYLERLNEIEYVEKREDSTDKRKNIYIPLVKEKQELLDNPLDSKKQIDLATILKNDYELWKKSICEAQVSYTRNILEDVCQTLPELESLVINFGKIVSVFDTTLFKYPDKAKTEQEGENKPKSISEYETQPIANKLEDLVSKTKMINRLENPFDDTCALCGFKGRMDWEIKDFDNAYALLCGPCGEKVAERLNKP
jgi:hypothetical protein